MYVAVRDGMLGVAKRPNAYEAMKALGVDGVEIHISREMTTPSFAGPSGKPYDLSTTSGVKALCVDLKAHGIRAGAFLMANDFSSKDLVAEVDWTVKTALVACAVGIPAVRIDLVPHRKDVSEGDFIEMAARSMKEVLAQTSHTDMPFGIENHGGTSNRQEFLDTVFDKVGSDRLGLTLDSGNFYWWGYPLDDVYKIMEHFASRVKHTHLKNIKYPDDRKRVKREMGWEYGKYVSPLAEGDIDHARVAKILKKAGYKGGLTIEDESLGKFPEDRRMEVLLQDIAHIRGLIPKR